MSRDRMAFVPPFVPACLLFMTSLCMILVPSPSSGSQAPALGPGRKYTTLERIRPERLAAVGADRRRYRESRKPVAIATGFRDYRAILHSHAEDSAHTGGTRPELLAAAKRMGVQIVMLSDHFRPPRDFIDESWRGLREGVLFIPGSENEGFLIHPQRSILPKKWTSREELIRIVRQDGGNIFLSHVEERFDWPTDQLDGLEIYNHHTDFKDESGFLFWLRGAFTDPDRMKQAQELLANHPIEFFGATQDYLAPIIQKWDRDLQSHPLTGVSANDCHHNLVYTIKALDAESIELHEIGDKPRRITTAQSPRVAEMLRGRAPGETIARLDMDPYDRSLGYVTTHILLQELNEPAVRRALRDGRAYVAHDWLCDPTGFAFIAERNGKRIGGMGDALKQTGELRLRLAAPAAGTIKLFRNGVAIREAQSDRMDLEVKEPGVYRAEVWLTLDGELRPWIYSNAIRIN
ncbi:MAG: histidinol phosphatase [Blastocatellia bacterium]|nr:histidinol phosphatase [Blastocatellia bacterium]